MLEALRQQDKATTLAVLAQVTGLHVNTVREHLEGLEEDGLVLRRHSPPSGRGRPASLYEAAVNQPPSEYAALATTLASAIHRHSRHPFADGAAAGRQWGADLALAKGRPDGPGGVAARRQVVSLLRDLGFAPEADARQAVVRLTRCPLLDAALRYPDVVCGVHLGVAQGALDTYGADPDRARLSPFSERGACRLDLLTRTEVT